MRFALLPLALAAACAAVAAPVQNQAGETRPQTSEARALNLGFASVTRGENGRIDLLSGATSLRAVDAEAVSALFKGELGAVVGLSADDSVSVQDVVNMADGSRFHRSQQRYRGVPVWGDGLVVQTDARGIVQAVFGSGIAISGLDVEKPRNASELFPDAVRAALLNDGAEVRVAGHAARVFRYTRPPQLAVFAADGHAPTLAWDADVAYDGGERPFHARVFVDARSGQFLRSYTFVQDAINRAIHNVNNACTSGTSGLPGTLVLSEGGTSTDTLATTAYRNVGRVYWWFRDAFGRDSYNGSGAKITVSVRVKFQGNGGCNGDNAYWSGTQILMGSGGTTFNDMNTEPDVMYHELGHAVTQSTSALVYEKQSGGMNEASSDIYAAAVEAWMNTVSGEPGSATTVAYVPDANTWLLGEGAKRDGSAALRYMSDPKKDGSSLDHYTQYTQQYGTCTPSANNDQCGVHLSSGIVNLAFYLLTNGGTHPRGGSTVQVTKIPFDRAIKYLYESHTSILQANDTFARLRNAMMTRARANGTVGACDEVRVGQAWDAVGVTGTAPANPNACSGSGGNQPPVAAFTATPSGLSVSFNGSGSSDPDGSIASYSWTFGDGSSGSGATTSKTYSAAGTYSVTLTVTDNQGATNSRTQSVTVGGGGGTNQPPVAAFTATPSGLSVSFNGNGSSDPDGSIASYSWAFGDGTSGSGATTSKTYSAAGTYSVTLTVTDNQGASNSRTQSVTVSGGGGQCPGTSYSGNFTGFAGQAQYQPTGGNYQSLTSGTHRACLSGPANTDFDIYLEKYNGVGWVVVAQSTTPTSTESLSYNGTAGYYRVRVVNYVGLGSYSLTLQKP